MDKILIKIFVIVLHLISPSNTVERSAILALQNIGQYRSVRQQCIAPPENKSSRRRERRQS